MKQKIIKRTEKIFLGIILFILIIQSVCAISLTINETYTVPEGIELTILLQATQNTGLTTFTKNKDYGVITQINNTTSEFKWTPDLTKEGQYQITFTATDQINSTNKATTITVTNTNDPILITQITEIGTTTKDVVKIELTTNKEADCKYSLNDNSFEDMEYTFSSTGTIHKGSTPKLAQGEYNLYILCEDNQGNSLTQTKILNFEVNLPPSASISLDANIPVKDERIKVSIITSEELIDTPTLNYYFDDDPTLRPITLVGSGKSWYGYIIIRTEDNERIGSFTFSGTDLTNIPGTKITAGEIFIVDTQKPGDIQSIDITDHDTYIRIDWSYDDVDADDVEEYKIYRKVGSGGTDYVDYETSTTKSYYLDDDVEYTQAYYYRVAAVDAAGNVGPLSKEVYITHIPDTDNEDTPSQTQSKNKKETKLDSKLLYKLNLEAKQIENTLNDINEADIRIGRAIGTDKLDVIQALGITTQIKTQKAKIENLLTELRDLENYDLTSEEFEIASETILKQTIEAWKETPTDITIIDSSTYQELTDDQKTQDITNLLLSKKNHEYTNKQILNLIEENKQMQDLITIDATIIKSTISYPDRNQPAITVKKLINTNNPIDNLNIVESIPKDIAQATDEIIFSEVPEIIEKDSIVNWPIERLSKKIIVYSILKELDLVAVKSVKTTIVSSTIESGQVNSITGLASNSSAQETSNPYNLPIIAGIVMISALAAYYFFAKEEENIDYPGKMNRSFHAIKQKFNISPWRIMPSSDSHRKIGINHEEFKSDKSNLDIQQKRVVNSYYPSQKQTEILVHSSPDTDYDAPAQYTEHKIADTAHSSQGSVEYLPSHEEIKNINRIQHDLAQIKKKYSSIDISDLQTIQRKTAQLKKTIEEIEDRNLEIYAENAKRALKEALRYINKENSVVATQKQELSKEKRIVNHFLTQTVPDAHKFVLKNGQTLHSLKELRDKIDAMSEETFRHHLNQHKNDFAKWAEDVFNHKKLGKILRKAKGKKDLKKILT